jgi:hypothetical protein
MNNNYTHILCIKVWSEKLGFCLKSRNVENIVKDKIINNNETINITYNNTTISVLLKWKLIKWKKPYDEMIPGDLVINSIYSNDTIIYEYTKYILEKIEKELKGRNLLENDSKIVFTIVKPIAERIPLVDTVGYIN